MSTSRLEKFVYAICSMEVSDLPAPLSRIEILWNCLITGESPDFEPQSRNEKYLMAMLGLYELENLPSPMSRGEKLLYKIAMGETDLSDVPGYLSRYEELLKYLIENGVLSDFEYVLYTLNQSLSTLYATVEKPVKSAILKGNTLVNLSQFHLLFDIQPSSVTTTGVSWYQQLSSQYVSNSMIKPNTKYIVKFGKNTPSRLSQIYISGMWSDGWKGHNSIIQTKDTITSTSNYQMSWSDGEKITQEEWSKVEIMIIEYQEGMENWDIPYFEGMQSVRMPVLTTIGQQLLNVNDLDSIISTDGTSPTNPTVIDFKNGIIQINETAREVNKGYKIKVEKNRDYIANCKNIDGRTYVRCRILDLDGNKLNSEQEFNANVICKFNSSDNDYVIVAFTRHTTNNQQVQIALYEGTVLPTTYEPFKSNILTVNEDMTLRSNGSVCDELDLLTGKLTQRIDEDGEILTQEVVKTVDLTTVDQDGQPTKLKTFNDISYVEINADNIIPSVDVEVATKISETLATLDPQQNDISETQNQLGQTIEEQTENTDATMMATTEIYEQTL